MILFWAVISYNALAQKTNQAGRTAVQFCAASSITQNQKDSVITFNNRQFWILHHSKSISETQFKEMKNSGIVLGTSFSAENQLASIPASFPLSELSKFGFDLISPFTKQQITESEKWDSFSDKAASPYQEYSIMPLPGIKSNEIESNWNPAWGKLTAVWPGEPSKFQVLAGKTQLDHISNAGWAQWIEKSEGDLIHFNSITGPQSRANWIKSAFSGGLSGLDGAGVTVAIGDGGLVETHADLETHQENLLSNKISTFGDHQDHVTGIVGGAGLLYADKQGIAPAARILNTTTSSVLASGVSLRTTQNVVLTNNSYGSNLNCTRAGKYSSTCTFVDNQLVAIPDLLHVFAAGNMGYVGCGGFPSGFKNISEGYAVSKNVLTVGATIGNDAMAWFSSTGPTMDGRVKPEIVVDGNNIVSTVPFDAYTVKGGTSQAAPAITGICALIVQRYRQIYSNSNPDNALLKGLLCNSAEDLGEANVDFKYGFGRVNARKAKRILDNKWISGGSIYSNETKTINVTAPANAKSVKVMLVWSDPGAAVNAVKDLINDLDLNVENAGGQSFLPWVMSPRPDSVGLPAMRRKDTLNNIEQVTFDVAGNETIKIKVGSKLLSGLNQKYWLVYDWVVPELVITHPLNLQKIKSGTILPIWWDKSGLTLSSLKVEMSTDSGQVWTSIATISNLNALNIDWSIPAANFQKRWFRLNAVIGGQNLYSDWVKTEAYVQPLVTPQPCDKTVKLNWATMPAATKYEVLVLNRALGKWETNGFTSSNTYILNKIENFKALQISVRPWKDGDAGIQSDAIKVTPIANTCPWLLDIGITALESPKSGRRLTSSDPGQKAEMRLKIQNYGSQTLVNLPLRIFSQYPQGQITYIDRIVSLQPQQAQIVNFADSLSLPVVGDYPLRFWLSANGDVNKGNDSLFTQVEVFSNPTLSLPWQFNAENIGIAGSPILLSSSKNNLAESFGLDYNTNSGQFKTDLPKSTASFGSKSLVLDKKKLDGTSASGELIFTLNLSNYASEEVIFLDFDWMAFGPLTTGNSLWLRTNDQAQWVEIIKFWTTTFTAGQVVKYQRLNLNPFLNGQELRSSFQLKFSQSGLRPSTMLNGGGYAIDNLMLSLEGNDIAVFSLVSPVNGCKENNNQKVKLKIENKTNEPAENVKVGYALPGQAMVEEIIPNLAGYATIEHEFAATLPAELLGLLNFKIWVNSALDQYPGNDTLSNQVVFMAPIISTFPYFEGFETSAGNWRATSSSSAWHWGIPSKNMSVIDTAANGKKIWANGLVSLYPNNNVSYVESPCFNISNLQTDIQFSFNSIFRTEQDYDYAWLDMSEDGINWKKIGLYNEGTNWYNHASNHWNGLRKNWEVSSIKIALSSIVDKSKVKFRFGFSSDASLNDEGFGFDDVSIEPAFNIVGDSSFSSNSSVISSEGLTDFGLFPGMVASIENVNLGEITIEMKRNIGPTRFSNGVPYLDRNFLIKPTTQPTVPVKVRLYITDAEVKKLVSSDLKIESFQQLGIYKYDGIFQDLTLDNNEIYPEKGTFIPASQVQKTPTAGGYFLEFFVSGFSEFYIASSSLEGPDDVLPLSLISFNANQGKRLNEVEVYWQTINEINTDRYELSYSADGLIFHPVSVLYAEISEDESNFYKVNHHPDIKASSHLIYRLSQFDMGSEKPRLYWESCALKLDSTLIWVQNPVQEMVKVHNISPNTEVQMIDARGMVWYKKVVESGDLEFPVTKIPKGNYWLQARSEKEHKTIPLIKLF